MLLMGHLAQSQEVRVGAPGILNFNRTTYQAGTQNWAIGQDEFGLVYFGNNKGLLSFNGADWELLAMPNRTIVRSFAFASQHRIYLGAQKELGVIHFGADGTCRYESFVAQLPEDKREFEDVWRVFTQQEEVIYCTEKALYVFDGNGFKVIEPPGERFENFFQVGDDIYIQDKGTGIFKYSNASLAVVNAMHQLKDERVVSIVPIGSDELLLVTAGRGIWRFRDGSLRKWQSPLSAAAEAHQAYCAIPLANGNTALGTSQNGLFIADGAGEIHTHVNTDKGLQNNTVLSIFEDAQHNLWLGLDNGLTYIELSSPFSFIGAESNIKGTGYAAMAYQGNLYLGTNQGLYRAQWPRKDMGGLMFEPVQNGLGQIWHIDRLSTGLVVSMHKGAFVLDNDKLMPISSVEGSWKFMELSHFPGYALQGTYTGFALYRRSNKEGAASWEYVKRLKGFDESARVFEEDNDGHIWVSHAYKGLFRLKLSIPTDVNEAVTAEIAGFETYGVDQGLPSELYINVERLRNEVLFTTPAGIYRYSRLAGIFEKFDDYEKVFGIGRNVHRIIEDAVGNLWFSIDNEFGVVNHQSFGQGSDMEISYFNQLQELLVDGFEHIYAPDARHVFIGTEEGFVYFDPYSISSTEFPFDVMISKVTSITGTDTVLYTGRGANASNDLPKYHHKFNDFRFEFTAPYYADGSRLQYKFKLEGFDDNWSEWTVRTQKEYTNLPHGNYAFKVQARNAFAVQSETAEFKFSILPPWWATLYAKGAFFILAIFALLLLIRFISQREKKKTEVFRIEQTQKMQRKEAEFKLEVEKSENEVIALRNEKLRADVNHKTSQLASTTMHLVQKTEMLQKLKTDLVKLTKEAPTDFRRKITQVTRAIDSDIQLDNNWDQFETYFDQVHENFFKRLRSKFPELTPKDQKLCAYLRMNLTTKEIAPLLNISVRGVEISRYRLRKKLHIDSDINLVEFIMDV